MTINSPLGDNWLSDPRLDALSQIENLERQLSEVKVSLSWPMQGSGENSPVATASGIRRLLKARRARDRFFDENLFADPAWDILLDAYAAYLLEQRISVSALCGAAAVPATTALRWLNKLEKDGLLVRRDDPLDGRRTWMEITAPAAATMRRYLEAISPMAPI